MILYPTKKVWDLYLDASKGGLEISADSIASSIEATINKKHVFFMDAYVLKDLGLIDKRGKLDKRAYLALALFLLKKYTNRSKGLQVISPIKGKNDV